MEKDVHVHPVSDHKINVENNVILTTKDEITVQQVFNYLTKNLDRFRVGSEFFVVCGVHGSDKGELMEGDEDFRYDYEMMFRWFKNHKKYSRQAQIVKQRCYNMETVVEVNSVEHESQKGKYVLDENSREVNPLFIQFQLLILIFTNRLMSKTSLKIF